MSEVTITWSDPDVARPALDVLVRLVALTDRAHEAGDIGAYLMRPGPDRTWVWTADLPSDLRTSYQLCPVRDRPLAGWPVDRDRWPAVEARYPVAADPARRVLAGHSLGAVAALHLAARRPDVFGSVVAGSAALWWPGGSGQVHGADVAAAYASGTPAGRLFLDAGTEEGSLLDDVRAFHRTLLAAGHDVTYREFRGGHDHACWRGSLADGLVAVLGQTTGSAPPPR